MNKINLILIVLVFFAFNPNIYAQNEKETTITNTQALFGDPIDNKKTLFEVNKNYNLHLIFQNETLIEIFVLQKDKIPTKNLQIELDSELDGTPVFDISDTGDPKKYEFLNKNEFDDIVSKLNSIKPLGKLIDENKISFLLNNKTFWYKEYENATIRLHRYSEEIGKQKDRCITDITIYFPESVVGKVISKERTELNNSYEIGVKSGKSYRKLYRVTKETYDAVTLNKTQTFKGIKAGSTPIYNSQENEK